MRSKALELWLERADGVTKSFGILTLDPGNKVDAAPQFLTFISINLLVVYRESVILIGYITRRLSADSLQL